MAENLLTKKKKHGLFFNKRYKLTSVGIGNATRKLISSGLNGSLNSPCGKREVSEV
jgi:hypothetical protein